MLNLLDVIVEMATFYLVVNMMLPITRSQREKRGELAKFMFCGFVNPEELENAILTTHTELTEEEIGYIRDDIHQLDTFLGGRGRVTGTIVAGMVDFTAVNDLAFSDFARIRLQKGRDLDVASSGQTVSSRTYSSRTMRT